MTGKGVIFDSSLDKVLQANARPLASCPTFVVTRTSPTSRGCAFAGQAVRHPFWHWPGAAHPPAALASVGQQADPAEQVVPGLDEGIKGMKTGGLRRVYVPGKLAFPKGLASSPGMPRIPPASDCIFDVELLYCPGMQLS